MVFRHACKLGLEGIVSKRKKMTVALDMLASHEPIRVHFGPDRTSMHEVFLRSEPCSVRAWLSKLGGAALE
jgi:hypothetical protein